jgi:hypothetical protein
MKIPLQRNVKGLEDAMFHLIRHTQTQMVKQLFNVARLEPNGPMCIFVITEKRASTVSRTPKSGISISKLF